MPPPLPPSDETGARPSRRLLGTLGGLAAIGLVMLPLACSSENPSEPTARAADVIEITINGFRRGDQVLDSNGTVHAIYGLERGATDRATLAALDARFAGKTLGCSALENNDPQNDADRALWCELDDGTSLARALYDMGAGAETCNETLGFFGSCPKP